MQWYHYLMCFFGGAFVANFVPHYVKGISGSPFPTPFAKPPGRGLSPPTTNVLWGLVNLAVGGLLLWGGHVQANPVGVALAFAGFALMAILLSKAFAAVPA